MQDGPASEAQSGANLDKGCMNAVVKHDDGTVSKIEKEERKVKDPDFRSWVDQVPPVVKQHQTMAHQIDKKLK